MKLTVTAVDEAIPNGEPAKKVTFVGFVAPDSVEFEEGQHVDAELQVVEPPAAEPGPATGDGAAAE